MLMSELNCINCLTNMTTSLVQLGLKGLHSHQFIQVKKSRHEEGSLEAVVDQDQVLLVLPLSLPPHLHLPLLFVSSQQI
jgi:hypothetical protein